MNINTKISVLVATALVFTAASIGSVAMWQINRTGEQTVAKIEQEGKKDIAQIKADGQRQTQALREQLLLDKKEYLKSQVQTTTSVLSKAFHDAGDTAKLSQLYEAQLQNAVNTAYGLLESIEKEPGLSVGEKQTKAAGLIKSLRYGPENKDYFWINDMQPKMIMHPYKPELDGGDLTDNKDPDGKPLFMEMVKVCREKGQGFVNYSWPKYGMDKPQPKLSFVKLYKPWNWVIGSGLYLETAEEKLMADAAGTIRALRYGPENRDYFWINDMQPKMIMHPFTPDLEGKDLTDNKDSDGKRLFMEMVKVCKEQGEGFVEYNWLEKGADKPRPKLSYVKVFKEWNWIIGTGLYIDDIDALVAARSQELEASIQTKTKDAQAEIKAMELEIASSVRSVLKLTGGITLLVLIVVVLIAYFFVRVSIAKPLHRIMDQLKRGADQVASASGQVASTSQSLAEGTSEHAASVEETSSSLEEISSMTRQNADNASEADNLMKAANQVVEKANGSMMQLIGSMAEITKSSEATSKIVKTIDEIAFQTNLLALNAAVEAARAGEAGAGFAVVADEVRNLALRAADAAKNTAGLIEGTVAKVEAGSKLVVKTDEDFSKVAVSADKVGALVAEIAAASGEQAQAIGHINTATAEMDKLIQQNAASAEESASAAEQMYALAEQLNGLVVQIVALVGGSAGQGKVDKPGRSEATGGKQPARMGKGSHKALAAPAAARKTGNTKQTGMKRRAEEIIPMDDEFEDF